MYQGYSPVPEQMVATLPPLVSAKLYDHFTSLLNRRVITASVYIPKRLVNGAVRQHSNLLIRHPRPLPWTMPYRPRPHHSKTRPATRAPRAKFVRR